MRTREHLAVHQKIGAVKGRNDIPKLFAIGFQFLLDSQEDLYHLSDYGRPQ